MMVKKMMTIGFPGYTQDTQVNKENAQKRWECYVGHMLDINPEMQLAGKPEVMPPISEGVKGFRYHCLASVWASEDYEPYTMRRV